MLPIGRKMPSRTAIIEPVDMRTDPGMTLVPADEMPSSAKPGADGPDRARTRMASDIRAQRKAIIKHRDEMARRFGRVVGLDEAARDWIPNHAASWRAERETVKRNGDVEEPSALHRSRRI